MKLSETHARSIMLTMTKRRMGQVWVSIQRICMQLAHSRDEFLFWLPASAILQNEKVFIGIIEQLLL